MSSIYPTNDRLNDTHRPDIFKSMNPREQLTSTVVWIVFLLLALLLRSMSTGFSLQ